MKAVVVNEASDGSISVVDRPVPTIGSGQVLVKVEYSGVCHTDLHVALGDFGQQPGRILGHEGIGLVSEVGSDVTHLKVGDRVSIAWLFKSCGVCEYCGSGRETLCRSVSNAGYSADGAMSEFVVAEANYAVKVPEGLDPAQASSITCAGVTTYKACKESGVRPGQWLVAFGAGGLGNLSVQYAHKVFGARVIAVDINEDKLAFAQESGAEHVINALDVADVPAKIKELTGGGAHAVICTAVAKAAFNQAVQAVRAGGTVVCIGLPPENMELSITDTVLNGIRILGSLVGTRQDLAEAFDCGARGLVVPKVTLRPVEDAPAIFKEMAAGEITGRMVLDFKTA
ncbi:MAG: alcohol dehydrogenase AdhP [Rothia sp. (in: high G+C Gram-positive bacteria)]|nr:alcohol dehydrogenase AdhP [Rothia sp. (in: high G+C Gram-positive bacteria)]